MIPSVYDSLIKLLHEKSQAEEINWQLTPQKAGNTFVLYIGKYDLQIQRNWGNHIELRIADESGAEIDEISVQEEHKEYDILNDIYVLARRKANKVAEAVKYIEEQTAKSGIIGT